MRGQSNIRRFIYERSVTNIRDWSLAYSFICTSQWRNWVILLGGRKYIYDRKDEIIHGLVPSIKCVTTLFRDMSLVKVWNAGGVPHSCAPGGAMDSKIYETSFAGAYKGFGVALTFPRKLRTREIFSATARFLVATPYIRLFMWR